MGKQWIVPVSVKEVGPEDDDHKGETKWSDFYWITPPDSGRIFLLTFLLNRPSSEGHDLDRGVSSLCVAKEGTTVHLVERGLNLGTHGRLGYQ